MSQYDFGTIDPTTKSGAALASDLMNWRNALHTLHGGANRPAYVQPGMLWLQIISSTQWNLMLYAGASGGDIKIGEFNPTSGLWTLTVGGGTFTQIPSGPSADPVSANQFARKAYVDAKINNFLPSGTTMVFVQATAPTGWTKDTSKNDCALRVVNGTTGGTTGGTMAFSAAFTSRSLSGSVGNTTLTLSQIPAHNHGNSANTNFLKTQTVYTTNYPGNFTSDYPDHRTVYVSASLQPTDSAGGGGAHNHPLTLNNLDLSVKYVNVIIAVKD
jgi:hypothetical protein